MKTYIITRRIYSYDGEYNELPVDIVRAESAKEALVNEYGSHDENGNVCWEGPLYQCEFNDRDIPTIGDEIGPHDDNDNWLGDGNVEDVPINWDECQSEGYLLIHEVKSEEAAKLLEHYRKIVEALEAV